MYNILNGILLFQCFNVYSFKFQYCIATLGSCCIPHILFVNMKIQTMALLNIRLFNMHTFFTFYLSPPKFLPFLLKLKMLL